MPNELCGTVYSYLTFVPDIYCYSCNDARLDMYLASHLANWGISVAEQQKTEKSMTELVGVSAY